MEATACYSLKALCIGCQAVKRLPHLGVSHGYGGRWTLPLVWCDIVLHVTKGALRVLLSLPDAASRKVAAVVYRSVGTDSHLLYLPAVLLTNTDRFRLA